MSKFLSAMNAAKDRSSSVAEALEAAVPKPVTQIRAEIEAPPAAPSGLAVPARRGRPAGKRSSLESVQVTAYIQADTHYATKIALLVNSRKGAPRKDFSDLVQELLAEWLKVQQ